MPPEDHKILEHGLSLEKQKLCKNAVLTIDYKNKKYDNAGCKNARRNGSAYCQACSDAYKLKTKE